MRHDMTSPLPAEHPLAEVAAALGETERYVADRCRQRVWPHNRGARGRITFTEEQYAEVLRLRAQPIAERAEPRWALAPRSRRAS